jgi:Tol biopolymer transport system component
MVENVRYADWTPDGGDLAVAVESTKGWRIESPPGNPIYQGPASGYLADLRFSPDGSRIAFNDHPDTNSGGSVAVVDRSGQRKVLTGGYSDIIGLAWSPKGDEIWFTARKAGSRGELRGVTLGGRERVISNQVAHLVIHDVAPDGRVLLASTLEFRSRIFYRGPNDARERELPGFDWALPRDISPDGKQILYEESGDGVGGNIVTFLRDVNAPAAVRLGAGGRSVFSPPKVGAGHGSQWSGLGTLSRRRGTNQAYRT